MARTNALPRGGNLALLGVWLVLTALAALSAACSSQEEQALSALHYFQRGNAAYQAEDYRRAIDHYHMALQFDDEAPDVYYNLGLAYYRAGAHEDAVEAYQQAVKLDPKFADAHLNLALAYDRVYNTAAANLHYNRYRDLVAGPNEARPIAAAGGRPAGAPSAQSTQSRAPGAGTGVAAGTGLAAGAGVAAGAGAATPAAAGSPARTSLIVPQGARSGVAPQGARSGVAPQGARSGSVPPADGLQSSQEVPPNPFQGNRKWWTQDATSRNR